MSISIYHITHINNLESILRAGGLIANSSLKRQQINYLDIAHENIQSRRANTSVPCSAGGVLHDYVPFYFASRSPMLYAIHKGNVSGYKGGQDSVIYLVSDAEIIEAEGLDFTFTDGHAVMAYADFYEELKDLDVIDWDLMESKYWYDTPEDPNRKFRRQAEFLIYQFCPWELITEIGVINQSIKFEVNQLLQIFNIEKVVNIQRGWYY